MLELALTVFVWGLVPGLGILGIFAASALNAYADRQKAQTAALKSERIKL